MSLHILVIGTGSVGKRHAHNLNALGCKISAVDLDINRVQSLAQEIEIFRQFNTIDSALHSDWKYDGAVIATPTGSHLKLFHQLSNLRLPILLEKPLAKNLIEATKMSGILIKKDISVLLGYTWRWWKPLQRVRELINANTIGKIRHVKFNMSAHLADWHPWEPYQSFFMASKDQGGGALLDESHWIDMMVWFFGLPEKLLGSVEKISDLEIETDDNVDVIAIYRNGLRITLHLDLYGRPHEKTIQFVGEGGTIVWTAEPNKIKFSNSPEQIWKEEIFDSVRNDMFVLLAKEFIDMINGKIDNLTCQLGDGLKVMKIIEMIRISSKKGKYISVEEIS